MRELEQTILTQGRFGHCEKCLHHDGYMQCEKGDPAALEMSAGGIVTWWKCTHRTLTTRLVQVVGALKIIAGYAGENGCCPYGCDTPHIAKTALGQYKGG